MDRYSNTDRDKIIDIDTDPTEISADGSDIPRKFVPRSMIPRRNFVEEYENPKKFV